MADGHAQGYYDEKESRPVARIGVQDAGRFVSAILRLFVNKGTLYVSSYDFGYWADRLACFRSEERVKLATTLPDPAFLENGFTITDEFIYVLSIDCLASIDVRSTFNQFLIYDKGRPLLQACANFEEVYLNVKLPPATVKTLLANGVIASWERVDERR